MRIGFPAGISLTVGDNCSRQLEHRTHRGGNIFLGRGNGAALTGLNADNVAGLHLDRSQIGRGLHQAGYVLTHGYHSMGQRLYGHQHPSGYFRLYGLLARRLRLQQELNTRIAHRIFPLYLSRKDVQVCPDGMFVFLRESNDGTRLTGNGITKIAAVNPAQIHLIFLAKLIQETGQQLVGIGTPQVNVTSRMTALQPLDLHTGTEISVGHGYFLIGELAHGIHTSRTTDKQLSLVFRVQIEQDIRMQESVFQSESTGQARLLVHGEQTLQGSMHQTFICQDGQSRGYAYAIVCTERSALGFHPFTLHNRFDGVGQEVVLHVIILLAHHVHMSLQSHRLAVLHAGCGRFFHQNVSGFIRPCFQTMLLSEVLQISDDFPFFLRGTRHLAYLFKIAEYTGRFQIFMFHILYV